MYSFFKQNQGFPIRFRNLLFIFTIVLLVGIIMTYNSIWAVFIVVLSLGIVLTLSNIRSAIIFIGALTCATAPLLALAIPIQLPLVGLLNVFKIGLFLLFGLISLYLLIKKEPILKLRIIPRLKYYGLFWILWIFWLMISMLWTSNRSLGVRYIFTILLMMILAAIFVILTNGEERKLKIFLLIILLSFIVVLLQGTLEKVLGWRIPQVEVSISPENINLAERFSSTVYSFFNQPNNFATYLNIFLPFFVLALLMTRRLILQLGALLLTAWTIYLIFLTVSRINYVVAFIIIVFAPFFTFIRRSTLQKIILFELVLFISGTIIIFLIIPNTINYLPQQALVKLQNSIIELSNPLATDTSAGRRIYLIKYALTSVFDSGLIGVGAGGGEDYLISKGMTVLNFHSWWLEILVVNGIFIFTAYTIFYFSLMIALYKIARAFKNSWLGYLSRVISLSLFAMIFSQNAPSSMIYFPAMWLLFGLAMSVLNIMYINMSKSSGNLYKNKELVSV